MKRSLVVIGITCSLLSALLGARAAAAEPGSGLTDTREETPSSADRTARLIAVADVDRDGSVSLAELRTTVHRTMTRRVLTRWRQLDRNRDGRVSRDEVPKMPATRFARFDVNRDGRITRAELTAVMARQVGARLDQRFAELDLDGDARCTLAELSRAAKRSPAAVVAVEPGGPAPREVRNAKTSALP